MEERIFQTFEGKDVTDDILKEAARLFSNNYGVWGMRAAESWPSAKPGANVKLSASRLRDEYLPENATCSYVRVIVNKIVAGHVFACRWTVNGITVCWVTQLVVHRKYREHGLAVGLLIALRKDEDEIYGIMSSHPAACLASAKAFGQGIYSVRLDYVKQNARTVMEKSPIKYVRCAQLRGNLFNPEDQSGRVSSVYTNFFVHHEEPGDALEAIKKDLDWPLGELFEGHEYLLIIAARRRLRST